MAFTDDNFKQLKEDLFGYKIGQLTALQAALLPTKLIALVERMDAAEAVCDYFSNLIRDGQMPDTVKLGLLAYWRKAAGK